VQTFVACHRSTDKEIVSDELLAGEMGGNVQFL
jgi:hypothetical protein